MDTLEAAGLTKNEAKIYTALIKYGTANVTTLAKRTGIHRRSVYDVIERLRDKGLVSAMMTNSVKKYMPTNPRRLKELMKEKETIVQKGVPELQKLFSIHAEKKRTEFYVGKRGIRAILDEQLRHGKEILVLGGNKNAQELLKYYLPKFHLIRKEYKIPMKMLLSEKQSLRLPLMKTKVLPEGVGGDIAINIYGNSVALIMWNKENPFAILVHEKEVADSFKTYFNYFWDKS